jgi:hypothetical protein
MLFANITELKTILGGAINTSVELDSLSPAFHAAIYNHLVEWISEAFWDEFKTAYDADTLSAEQTALLPYLQRPLAKLAMYEYQQIGTVQFTESGLNRIETETHKSAYRYQENAYSNFMLLNGYEDLERLLVYLETNKADFATWTGSDAYTRNRSLFITYASEFRRAYGKQVSRYVFEIMRPVMSDIETFAVLPLLGEDQFADLKAKILAGTTSSEEDELHNRIIRAVANYAMEESLKRELVQHDGNKVVQLESSILQSNTTKRVPDSSHLDVTIRHSHEFANRHLSYVKEYLDNNLDTFTLYSAYLDAQAEAEAAEEAAAATNERGEGTTYTWDLCTPPAKTWNKIIDL